MRYLYFEELNPCPKCKNKPSTFVRQEYPYSKTVICNHCNIAFWFYPPQNFIEEWNKLTILEIILK